MLMFADMSEKTYTARQIAEHFNVAGSTARGWLLRGLFPGARLKQTDLGDSYWVVPESAVKDFTPPKPGPVPKSAAKVPAKRRAKKEARQ
jgi:hypothetical protein